MAIRASIEMNDHIFDGVGRVGVAVRFLPIDVALDAEQNGQPERGQYSDHAQQGHKGLIH